MKYAAWRRPDLEEERDEFERVAVELGIFPDHLQEAARAGTMVALDDRTWSSLQNTDSWEITDMAVARQYAKQYGRTVDHIAAGFMDESPMPAPIVMKMPGGMITLISGNTRLMVARALDVRPTVLMFDMPMESKGRPHSGRVAGDSRDYVICRPDDGLLYVEVPNFDHLRNLLITQRWRGEPHLRTRHGYIPYHGGGIAFDFLALRLRGVLPTWYPKDNARQDSALRQVLEDGIYADEREARRHRQQASYVKECEWVGPSGMHFDLEDVQFVWLGSRPGTRPSPDQLENFRELFPNLELHEGPPITDTGSVLAKLRRLANSLKGKS